MLTILSLLFSFSSIIGAQQGNLDTDHLIINNTNENFVITVELIDRANDPTYGTAMFEVPAGSAMILSQVKGKSEFIPPTNYYTYKIMSGTTTTEINHDDSWTFEKISETNGRFQCILN